MEGNNARLTLLRACNSHSFRCNAQYFSPCRALADLAVPLKSRQVYRPTQDPGGAHRAVLQRVVDAMLALAAQQAQRQGRGAAAVAGAVLRVLQGILDVEHRPIQAHLPALWALLLEPRPAEAIGDASGGSSRGRAAAAGAPEAAVAVACSLVGAYAELRQLEVLLQSLAAALLEPSCRRTEAPAGAAAAAAAAAAAGVVCSHGFLSALAAAVRGLPSGQAAAAVRWVAAQAARLGEADPSDPMLPVCTEVRQGLHGVYAFFFVT